MTSNLSFNWPQAALFLFLLIPILYAYARLNRYRSGQEKAYASLSTLSRLIIPRSSHLNRAKIAAWAFIWIFICLALMGPYGNIRYSSHSTSKEGHKAQLIPHELILLVDTSASMGVPDGPDGETRLEEAKGIMEELIRLLQGELVSLYAFTSELTPLVPSTLDYLFTRLSIKELHIDEGDVGGTLLGRVLTALREQAFPNPSQKRYTIFLFSDGGDNRLELSKGAEKEEEREKILNAIPNPQELHLRLYTIGVGSPQPKPIPNVSFNGKSVESGLKADILKELAAHERGNFYSAENWTSWDLTQEIKKQMEGDHLSDLKTVSFERQVAPVNKEDRIVDLFYQVPLGLALLFYFLNLLLPARGKK